MHLCGWPPQSSCSCFADDTVVAVSASSSEQWHHLWITETLMCCLIGVQHRSSCHPSCPCLCDHNYARSPCKRGPNCSSQSEGSKQILARCLWLPSQWLMIPACVRPCSTATAELLQWSTMAWLLPVQLYWCWLARKAGTSTYMDDEWSLQCHWALPKWQWHAWWSWTNYCGGGLA